MTDTEKLTRLLKKAVPKWPDRFSYSMSGDIVYVQNIRITIFQLDNPERFTLDHMDAISAAVGMEFDAIRTGQDKWDWSICRRGDDHEVREGFTCETKREASIAALNAILEYKMGDR
jgi:hypothetical protein